MPEVSGQIRHWWGLLISHLHGQRGCDRGRCVAFLGDRALKRVRFRGVIHSKRCVKSNNCFWPSGQTGRRRTYTVSFGSPSSGRYPFNSPRGFGRRCIRVLSQSCRRKGVLAFRYKILVCWVRKRRNFSIISRIELLSLLFTPARCNAQRDAAVSILEISRNLRRLPTRSFSYRSEIDHFFKPSLHRELIKI
jgi:hypothetical protein